MPVSLSSSVSSKANQNHKKKVQILMKKTHFTENEINRLLDIHYQIMVQSLKPLCKFNSQHFIIRKVRAWMQSWTGRSFVNFCMRTLISQMMSSWTESSNISTKTQLTTLTMKNGWSVSTFSWKVSQNLPHFFKNSH